MAIKGIDVSRYQGTINWPAVAGAGYKFAIIRATAGNYYVDPLFESNWDGAQAAGLQVGAYHVVRADNTVESQLLKLRGVLDGNNPKLVALDAEVTPSGMTKHNIERAHYWMGRKTREFYNPLGCKVAFYSAAWWWNPQIGLQDWVAQDPFLWWMAAYGGNDGQPAWQTPPASVIPIGWPRWDCWQFSSRGAVPGIVGSVDLNMMKEEVFAEIWGQPAPPPPTPPPSDTVTLTISRAAATELHAALHATT